MCGIVGWVRSSHEWDRTILKRAADRILHRGPDNEGFFWEETERHQVGFAHRRLSIIDLGGGAQPMVSADGNLVLIFNGEIYNFREIRNELIERYQHEFRTASDTEVLLAAYLYWGEKCLDRLRGMFALAIWNRCEQELFIARDRFGKKPLFLIRTNDGLAFASEIKSLLELPIARPGLNEQAVRQYLVFRYVPGPLTFFEGIIKLPQGCFARLKAGVFVESRYFTAPESRADAAEMTDQQAIESFRALLDESVKLRLVSDVPFGAFLSGGVDSSAIVALMSRHLSEPVRTFSVGFSENDPGELPYARVVAKHFHTQHHEVVISPQDIIDNLPAAITALDGPVSEPATIPLLLLSREAARHVKMVLSGEGADEFFGGYVKHALERYLLFFRRVPAPMRHSLRLAASAIPDRRFARAAEALQIMSIKDPRIRYPRWFAAFADPEFAEFAERADMELGGLLQWDDWTSRPLRGLLLFDQTSWLPDNLLERGDRMSMAASLEARMPFMDQNLAEFAARLPDGMRVRGWTGKWLLRNAMRDLLPEIIFNRKKRGFPVPLKEWFKDRLRPLLQRVLLDDSSRSAKILGKARLETMLNHHKEGKIDATKPIWLLLNLDLFCNAYGLRS